MWVFFFPLFLFIIFSAHGFVPRALNLVKSGVRSSRLQLQAKLVVGLNK